MTTDEEVNQIIKKVMFEESTTTASEAVVAKVPDYQIAAARRRLGGFYYARKALDAAMDEIEVDYEEAMTACGAYRREPEPEKVKREELM